MKTALLSIAAVLALSTLSIARADNEAIQIKGAHAYHMMQEDFQPYKNSYQLQDGQVITFSQRMAHYYTQTGRGDAVEIFPVAKDVFLTADGMRVQFRDGGESVSIANIERLPLAGKQPINSMVIAYANARR